MRANDSFRLFSSAPAPVVAKTSPELEALNTAELDTEIAPECGVQNKEDPIVLTRTKQFAKQRLVDGYPFNIPLLFIIS
jgi:hypothetical protein